MAKKLSEHVECMYQGLEQQEDKISTQASTPDLRGPLLS